MTLQQEVSVKIIDTIINMEINMKIKSLSFLIALALPIVSANASVIPTNGKFVNGDGTISRPTRNEVLVQQNTAKGIIDWTSFNIGKGYSVKFKQPDSNSVTLNRVTGSGLTNIVGNLTSNGRVFLVNPNGIMLRSGANINVGGLVATTKQINNNDFISDKLLFSSGTNDNKQVVNQANIKTPKGGFVVLASDKVMNSGRITTPSGKTVLASAEKIVLQLDSSGLKNIAIDGEVANAFVSNSSFISATNGQVYLTALGKDMLMNTVINNNGIIEASGFSDSNPNISINGGNSGKVSLSGQMIANHTTGNGGVVNIDAKHITLEDFGSIDVSGKGNGGSVNIGSKKTSTLEVNPQSTIIASSLTSGNGGNVKISAKDKTTLQGTIEAKGGSESGNGGNVIISTNGNLTNLSSINVQAANGQNGNIIIADTIM